ncbi:MAG TPA: YbhB/YbcL family Raf kinase inhibitor-like protein [Saprospiraceae bacterium]|nr:YbhB/YbcL family Raf kinase inhibitor-like protein [Saprospiraceae bacterium]HHH52209.1 YbhB/YbcL family Raf kinase inhibitor-like protein [Bacteroidota bacterium]
MKKLPLTLILILFVAFTGCSQTHTKTKTFTLRSDDVGGQATLQQVYSGCGGENKSPHLIWENAPEGTKSFAVTIFDKDAPTGSGWWHWLIFNIPADVHELKTDAGNVKLDIAPVGSVQSKTDFGEYGYGGPCPPKGHGIHQYLITVYALNKDKLDLNKDVSPATVGFNLNFATIQKASIVMYYERK